MIEKKINGLFDTDGLRFNLPEKTFFLKARSNRWGVLRKGWPDFLLYKNGRIAFVEVKKESDKELADHQRLMLSILTEHGLPCWVWTPKAGFKKFKPIPPFKK